MDAGAAADRRFLSAALALARRRVGLVGARPAVGAVIVRDGRVIGRGATGPDGRPHAEAVAIGQARQRYGETALRGATAYVTLEPCAHQGRTPPCTGALIAAGIGRVVSTFDDPDPRVSGRGFAALRAAGVDVVTGVCTDAARTVNRGFLKRMETGQPWLTLKLATTLDGRIATRTGESRWITGPAARARVHLMRLRADAVLIGAGTARADDPMLDVRGFGPVASLPLRVIADGHLTLPAGGRLARSAREVPVLAMHLPGAAAGQRVALEALGVTLAESPEGPDGHPDPGAMLRTLGMRGVNTVLAEGGGAMAASLLAAGLVDEVALFTAGKAIGGDGIAAVGSMALERLGAAPGFVLASVDAIGGDVLTLWRRHG